MCTSTITRYLPSRTAAYVLFIASPVVFNPNIYYCDGSPSHTTRELFVLKALDRSTQPPPLTLATVSPLNRLC